MERTKISVTSLDVKNRVKMSRKKREKKVKLAALLIMEMSLMKD